VLGISPAGKPELRAEATLATLGEWPRENGGPLPEPSRRECGPSACDVLRRFTTAFTRSTSSCGSPYDFRRVPGTGTADLLIAIWGTFEDHCLGLTREIRVPKSPQMVDSNK
jgi:hypothetical protein